jgi:hypothetical protein
MKITTSVVDEFVNSPLYNGESGEFESDKIPTQEEIISLERLVNSAVVNFDMDLESFQTSPRVYIKLTARD